MSNTVIRHLRSQSTLTLAGIGSILVAGLIHLILTPEHFEEVPYLGWLFLADFTGAVAAAFGMYQGYRWGWVLGALVASGAIAVYFVSATVGLPGMERGYLLEPVGVLSKVVEALFLVLCAFELTRSRRWALVSSLAAALAMASLVVAPGLLGLTLTPESASAASSAPPAPADHPGGKKKMGELPILWSATSPSIQRGDQYTLVVKNTGEEDQQARIRTMIMDHHAKTNTAVLDEDLELAPGEEREFTAVNDYGTANHFKTDVGSETKDLGLAVKINNEAGIETAQYNQGAFMIQQGQEKAEDKKMAGDKAHDS